MKSVHLLGLGFVVGLTALGILVVSASFRWSQTAFPATGAPGGQQPVVQPGSAASADVTAGETMFKQKCASCHTIGGGKLVGPDLKGVTSQRSHDYLISFITAPDKVIASNDPTATQLVKEYGAPMPNLGVTSAQAEQLIAYIQAQSGGGAPAPAAGPTTPAAVTSAPAAATSAPVAAPAPAGPTQPAPAATAPAAGAAPQGGFQPTGNANNGKTVFAQKCASCHSIGGGKLVGPDLKGITSQRSHDYLINFITAPDKVIASNDPTAAQLVKEYGIPMPNLGISQGDAEDILAYVFQQSGGAAAPPGAAVPPPGGALAAAQIAPGDAGSGHALFTGEMRLSGGGPACIACHNVAGIGILRGGTWGLDLTNAQSKSGTQGIASILKAPPFPGMTEAFVGHPISNGEIADLEAFFIEVNNQQTATEPEFVFPLVGVSACTVMLAIALLAWLGRTPSVRRQLVGGSGR
jgi:mono/diheme cytochrome c family protein